jgi:hypothetical protein
MKSTVNQVITLCNKAVICYDCFFGIFQKEHKPKSKVKNIQRKIEEYFEGYERMCFDCNKENLMAIDFL